MLDPRSEETYFNVAVIADWAKMIVNPFGLDDVVPYLKSEIESRKIDALLIAGDIGYDLHSNNGVNYEDFLTMVE